MNSFLSQDNEATEAWASNFAKSLHAGDVVCLTGDLGAGKTTFVRGLYLGRGGKEVLDVSSPTFSILQEYSTPQGPVFHFDLYRLNSENEFWNLDFEEYLGESLKNKQGITVIEWGDKFKGLVSEFTHHIQIEITGENSRRIVLS